VWIRPGRTAIQIVIVVLLGLAFVQGRDHSYDSMQIIGTMIHHAVSKTALSLSVCPLPITMVRSALGALSVSSASLPQRLDPGPPTACTRAVELAAVAARAQVEELTALAAFADDEA